MSNKINLELHIIDEDLCAQALSQKIQFHADADEEVDAAWFSYNDSVFAVVLKKENHSALHEGHPHDMVL